MFYPCFGQVNPCAIPTGVMQGGLQRGSTTHADGLLRSNSVSFSWMPSDGGLTPHPQHPCKHTRRLALVSMNHGRQLRMNSANGSRENTRMATAPKRTYAPHNRDVDSSRSFSLSAINSSSTALSVLNSVKNPNPTANTVSANRSHRGFLVGSGDSPETSAIGCECSIQEMDGMVNHHRISAPPKSPMILFPNCDGGLRTNVRPLCPLLLVGRYLSGTISNTPAWNTNRRETNKIAAWKIQLSINQPQIRYARAPAASRPCQSTQSHQTDLHFGELSVPNVNTPRP